MRKSMVAAVLAVSVVFSVLPVSLASARARDVVIAVLDTGVRATHQEFDYRGPNSGDDQFVAWWDFSSQLGARRNPAPGQLWDTRAPDPYDGNGHGTATASMAAGRNINPYKMHRAFAPGFKLAIGKVVTDSGAVDGDIAAGIRWSVDTVQADIISISIAATLPLPSTFHNVDEAIHYARLRGVLVTVANGNGFGNAGAPGNPGWASPFSTTDTISVGASGNSGLLVTTDPEVTARFTVQAAAKTGDTAYAQTSGTSFSNPTVAGMAAAAKQALLDNGHDTSPEAVETLIKFSARDTDFTPNFEGYGTLDAAEFDDILMPNAVAGTLPQAPSALNTFYVESVSNRLRDVWSRTLDGGMLQSLVPTGIASTAGPTQIGASLPEGLSDVRTFTFTATIGQAVSLTTSYLPTSPEQDLDLYVFTGRPSTMTREDLVKSSTGGSGATEQVSFLAPYSGTYTVAVVGWLVAETQNFQLNSNVDLASDRAGYFVSHSSQGLA